ncbi:MAG: hypothetical protein NXH97_03765 [Rhodobacteraceae bacterium]|nr:hypothetical protein [Paracoccaceae bacterium]
MGEAPDVKAAPPALPRRFNTGLKGQIIPVARRIAATLVWALLATASQAGELYQDFPDRFTPDHRYIIYVHGRIIETEGIDPVSERFGRYEYTQIVDALAQGDAAVIAPVRKGDTDAFAYADHLAAQIERMVAQGVSPEHITLAGFSKGGYIILLTANRLQNPSVRYVVMAGCVAGIVDGSDANADGLQGAVLSMVEAADDLGFSCAPLFSRNPQLAYVRDVTFQAGTGHGFFYRADPAWIAEVLSWSEVPAE